MPMKPAPLNATFMLTAILGFLISAVYIRKIDLTWAFAFSLLFILMIIASLISMIQAPVRGQLMPKFEREIRDTEPVIAGESAPKAAAKKKLKKKKPARKQKKAKKASKKRK